MVKMIIALEDEDHALYLARCRAEGVYLCKTLAVLAGLFARGGLPASAYSRARSHAAVREGGPGRGWKRKKKP